MTPPEIEYIRADPRLRRTLLLVTIGLVLLGAAAVGWFLPWLGSAIRTARYNGTLNIPLACYLFLVAIALLAGGVTWLGIYLARFARRVVQTGQYPPPGTRVFRDTAIIRGPYALFTGKAQFVLGTLLALCGVALFALTIWGFLTLALR